MRRIEIPPDRYPIGAYRKVQFGAVMNLSSGIIFLIIYALFSLATGNFSYGLFFFILGIWFIFTAIMLRKACKMMMSGDIINVRKGGKIALIFGALGLSFFAFIGGSEAIDWRITHTYGEDENFY